MLVLRFTCRVLLVLVAMESVRSDRAAPLLIAENLWPRGCVLDCQRGRHRAVCGSNGRLYKSLCAFQRARCINTQLRLAPRARCSDPGLSKCQLAQSQAREAQNSGGHVSPAAAIFVPQCHPDGHFLPVQCHNQTGYCWCSTPDGEPISGSSVFRLIPDCAEHTPKFSQFPDGDSAPIHDEAGEPATTAKPRKSAVLTAPPFWVTILINSDPKGARSVRRPTDGSQTCEHERASLFSQLRSVWQEERFIPECTGDGRYNPVQCHAATGYCWCVRVDSGRPLPGTSARNRIPDCSGAEEQQYREKPLPGCPGARKKQFLKSLVRALQQEAQHAASLKLPSNSPPSSPPAVTPPTSTPSSSTSTVLDVASPPPALDPEESSRPEAVLRWHFRQLDADSSGVLSEREARPLRQFLRRRLKPRRCAKKFAQHCDRDGDRGLALEELRVCLGV